MNRASEAPLRVRESLEEIAFYENSPLAKVAKYMLESEDVLNITVNEILTNCGVTSPTPTRLAKKINLSGFKELKVKLDIQNNAEANSKRRLLSSGLNKYKEEIFNTFNNIYDELDEKQLNQISDKMMGARKIICISEGTHNNYLTEFCLKLKRIGIEAECPIEEHEKYITLENVKDNDLLIFVSLSGTTKSTINGLKHVLKSNCEKIMITANYNFGMLDITNIVFINTNETIRQIGNINTRLAIISVLDILYLNIIREDFEANIEKINKTKLRNLYITGGR